MSEFGTLNLNLLVPLDALLRHRSVTEAARSLHIGQPAMSTTLGKLRRHYGDELLVRVGNNYELTPLAESLVDPVGLALSLSRTALAARESSLDLGDLHRTFTLGVSEYELTLLGGEIVARVRAQAPHVRIAFDVNRSEHTGGLESRLQKVDAIVVPERWSTGWPSTPLLTDEMCCVVSVDNTTVTEPLDRDGLAALRLVFGEGTTVMHLMGATMLRSPLRDDQVVATTDSLAGQIATVVDSDLACLVPRRLLPLLGRADRLRVLDAPELSDPFAVHLAWHPARGRDAGIGWLRGVVVDAAAAVVARDHARSPGRSSRMSASSVGAPV